MVSCHPRRRVARARVVVLALALVLGGVACTPRPLPNFGGLQTDARQLAVKNTLQMFEVSNGMVVVLAPDERTNLVSVDVRYHVGSAQDPKGRAGLAHLVEHLTFEVASGEAGATISDRLAEVSLTHNAYTNHDVTHYTATALAEHLDALLDLEAQRLEARCDRLADALIARERDVVLAEEAERRSPVTGVLHDVATQVWGDDHAYARPVGTREVAAATKADVCAFLDAYYVPARAVLVVTGNFDPAQLQPRIGRRFGPIAHPGAARSPRVRPVSLAGTVSDHRADVDHPIVQIVLPAPTWGDPGEALHDLLLAAYASELAELDRKHDWVVDADVGYGGAGQQRTTVINLVVTEPGQLDKAVDAAFARGRVMFRDDDRASVIRRIGALRGALQTATVTRFDAIGGRGDWLADYLTYTDHREFAIARLSAIDAITAGALEALAGRLFDRERSHIARVQPTGTAGAASTDITSAGARTYDVVPWRLEIDPAEAARPLDLPRDARQLDVQEYTLANGLRVLTFFDSTSPIVDARMIFQVGTIDDAPAGRGVARLAAHLLDHDVERVFPREVAERLNWAFGVGTQVGAAVDDSVTIFSTGGLAAFGDWHVWRLAWLLDQGVYPARDLALVRQNLREQGDDDVSPSAVEFRGRLFGRRHPYAMPRPTVAELATIGASQLGAWRRAHFVPAGATLIVTGGFDGEAMHRVIEELFGGLPARPAVPRAPVPPPRPGPGPTWLGVRIPTAAQVSLYVSFTARSDPRTDRAARMVLSEMVNDRLRIVREGLGASYGVRSTYIGGAAGTVLSITTGLDPARAPEAAVAVMRELTALRGNAGAEAAAFARARRRVLAQLLATSRDATTVANELEWTVRNDLGLNHLHWLPAKVAKLTPAEVAAVAAGDLDPARMVVSVDGPVAPVTATLDAVGATDPIWFDE